MTDPQKLNKIKELIEIHTKKNIVSRDIARKCLIDEGIYTKKGELKVVYGGVRPKKKSVA